MPRRIRFREIWRRPDPTQFSEIIPVAMERASLTTQWMFQPLFLKALSRDERNRGLRLIFNEEGKIKSDVTHSDIEKMRESTEQAVSLLKNPKIRQALQKGLVPRQLSRRKNLLFASPNLLWLVPLLLPPEIAKEIIQKLPKDAPAVFGAYTVLSSLALLKCAPKGDKNKQFIEILKKRGITIRNPFHFNNLIRKPVSTEQQKTNSEALERVLESGKKLISIFEEYGLKFENLGKIENDYEAMRSKREAELAKLKGSLDSKLTPVQLNYRAGSIGPYLDELAASNVKVLKLIVAERTRLLSEFNDALAEHFSASIR
ncbi:MAG: hypothetical protein V1835_01450 [Candidatus Micrarchaeota archaeon]